MRCARVSRPVARVVVVGAGWIGSEFAASARQRGLEVTIVDPLTLPNERIFGAEIGAFYRDVHARARDRVAARRGSRCVRGRRRGRAGAHDQRPDAIECDFAVVGIGVAPRVRAGPATPAWRSTTGSSSTRSFRPSAPNVFAAGDVANAWHPFYRRRIRVEHWANALNQGPAAARAMLGQQVSYDRIPYFFSDQYEVGMEYSGYATEWDEVVFRGERDSGEFVAFWLRDGRVLAGMNVNVWDVNEHVQALIRSRQAVDVGRAERPRHAARLAGRAAHNPNLRSNRHGPEPQSARPARRRAHRSGLTRSRASCWTAASSPS